MYDYIGEKEIRRGILKRVVINSGPARALIMNRVSVFVRLILN